MRSPASILAQGVARDGSGQGSGTIKCFAEAGLVIFSLGPHRFAIKPDGARWLSAELQKSAFMVDGKAVS